MKPHAAPRRGDTESRAIPDGGRHAPARGPQRHTLRIWGGVLLGAVGLLAIALAVVLLVHRAPEGLNLVDGELEVPTATETHVAHPTLAGPTTMAVAEPASIRVEIPALGIEAPIGAELAKNSKGSWVPPGHELGRWETSAALTATSGTTMLAGHVWVGSSAGVLENLHKVEPGNLIRVVVDGAEQDFLVSSRAEYSREALPDWVFGSTAGPRGLVLVTCAGRATDSDGHRVWSRNLVVQAVPTHVGG